MLVATRDPMPQPGAHDAPPLRHDGAHGRHLGGGVPRVARFMTVLQLAGSLLAIPVGLASAYSIYRANFSPDTQCQALRSNIIAMIDKKIDAATRRMLVRRDVETFEKTCGAFDPDAKAAFVTLLAEPRGTPLRAVVVPKAEAPKAEAAKAVAPKAEPAKAAAKAEGAKPESSAKDVARKAEPETAARDALSSDTRWLDSVRGALVSHEAARDATAAAAVAPRPADAAPPMTPMMLVPPAASAPATAAPALPPATAVAAPVAPQPERADPDHPVPPASIPENSPSTADAGWVAKIPFVGQVLAR